MSDGLVRTGNYPDGSTFWTAAPGVTPIAMTPERIAALDKVRMDTATFDEWVIYDDMLAEAREVAS